MVCYNCQEELAEDQEHCPSCGRSQYRICFCGEKISKAELTCPHCGADWKHKAKSVERRRRRSRSHRHRRRLQWRKLYTYILVGFLGGAILGPLLAHLGRALFSGGETAAPPVGGGAAAATTLGASEAAPRPLTEPDAITALQDWVTDLLKGLGRAALGFLTKFAALVVHHPALFGGAALGAGVGALVYFRKGGLLRFRGSDRRRVRRRRRAY